MAMVHRLLLVRHSPFIFSKKYVSQLGSNHVKVGGKLGKVLGSLNWNSSCHCNIKLP